MKGLSQNEKKKKERKLIVRNNSVMIAGSGRMGKGRQGGG